MIIEVNEEELQELLAKYGYQFPKYEYFLLKHASIDGKEDGYIWGDSLTIAQFVKFLRQCGDENSYKITSTIKHPQKGKVKGSTESFTFSDRYMNMHLLSMAEQMLHYVSEGEYEYHFNWDEKETSHDIGIEGHYLSIEGFHEVKEPYTDEELDKIIEYEKAKAQRICTGNAAKGKRLCFVYHKFKEAGHFGQSKQKEYSFLYDWYVLAGLANDIGKGYLGSIGKEKYQQVKNWITAYENFRDKQNKLND